MSDLARIAAALERIAEALEDKAPAEPPPPRRRRRAPLTERGHAAAARALARAGVDPEALR